MHTDTIPQTYALIECLERDMLDERDSVYLYVISFAPNSTDFVSLPLTIGRT